MRIVYGVHGYGRGHATRSLAIVKQLVKDHQVSIIAGGDAFSAISPDFPVTRIPTLGFAYGKNTGKRSNFQTLRRNLSAVLDLMLHGPTFDMVRNTVQDFSPDVIISDAEPWTHRVATHLRIPRVSIDHIGILAYCRPKIEWHDRLEASLDTFVYQTLMGNPDRIIVSSFYDAPPRRHGVKVVGTLVRDAIHDVIPTTGDHILVYFNKGRYQMNKRILQGLQDVGVPIRIYGGAKEGREGNLTFLPLSNLPFLEDLASCRAVISTAGNQLMGEAIYLGKPVLVIPERCVEQRLNAAAVERLGIGMRTTTRRLTAQTIRGFLSRRDEYISNMQKYVRDGLAETMVALETFLEELVPGHARTRHHFPPTNVTSKTA